PHGCERARPHRRRSDYRISLPEVRHLQTCLAREEDARRTTGRMGVADPAATPPPGHGMARPPGGQERETLPRDPARGDDRRGPQAQTRATGNEGQGARQGSVRVRTVRRRVAIASVTEVRAGTSTETR